MSIHIKFFGKAYLLLLIGLVLLSALLTGMASAQAPSPSDDQVNQVASQLFCPICDNMPLDVCPLEACHAWRELIREQLADGWTEREIKAYFVAQYGDRVLGEPPRSGLNWILYLVPPLILLTGLILMISKMKHPEQRQTDLNSELVEHKIQQSQSDRETQDNQD